MVEKPSTSATDRRTPDAACSKILAPLLAADLLLLVDVPICLLFDTMSKLPSPGYEV